MAKYRIMYGLKELERGNIYRFAGRFSGVDQTTDVLSKRWTERIKRIMFCKHGWHFWCVLNPCIWFPIRDESYPEASAVFLIQARHVTVVRSHRDKAVAEQIRYIRLISKAERNKLTSAKTVKDREKVFQQILKATNPARLKAARS